MIVTPPRQLNTSTLSSSARTRLFNDSTNGFSHSAPGSINAAPVRLNPHQSLIAIEVISGPLSHPPKSGG